MITKILIANRGEIALRVIRTCKRMGIETVTIYSQGDASLPHAKSGDENICLGSGTLAQTYLNQDKIVQIAKETGAQAIHPGYGFLSENAAFCQRLSTEDLIFIGPSIDAINLMGDKKESKIKMETLGIPLIQGFHGENQEPELLKREANKIGYPVLIKATAGGGGKGMRIVENEEEFFDALDASKREALNAFSNDKVLIEKYIVNPRHIEVQLVSDAKGNHFHFYDRECSIQRRYQKIIEESPSPAMDEVLRSKICDTALKISEGINYIGAGTIEFILADNGEFYFLEMNTRLQVEHPVTELVTGFDLVELQILAASGEAFKFDQKDIKQFGHAIECRIYAEDPDNEFLPTIGRIQKIHSIANTDYRLDCGYSDGNNISTSFDPMLAKVIVHDSDRITAIEKMYDALDDVLFGGAKTNRDFLKRVLSHNLFVEGNVHTHFIAEQRDMLEPAVLTDIELAAFIAGSMLLRTTEVQNVWDMQFKKEFKSLYINGETLEIELIRYNRDGIEFIFNNNTYKFETLFWTLENIIIESLGLTYNIHSFTFSTDGLKQVFMNDREALVRVIPKASRASSNLEFSEGSLQSPMPGKIFKIIKKLGESVRAGDAVLIVEAMKMEHTVKATKDGVVKEIFFKEGDQVQGGVLLCEIN